MQYCDACYNFASSSMSRCYTASVVAIAKQEQSYIQEFVNYHVMIGFDHVYIYDNGSEGETPMHEILAKEIAKGWVTVIPMPGTARQRLAYHDYIKNRSMHSEWVAIIDVDEFIVLKQHSTVREFIKDKCSALQSVAMNWIMFGFNGHETRPPGLVTENYTRGSLSNHVKTFARTEFLRDKLCRKGAKLRCVHNVAQELQRLDGSVLHTYRNAPNSEHMEYIHLNHYWSKSVEEFKKKIARGRAPSNRKRDYDTSYNMAKGLDHSEYSFMKEHRVPLLKTFMSRHDIHM